MGCPPDFTRPSVTPPQVRTNGMVWLFAKDGAPGGLPAYVLVSGRDILAVVQVSHPPHGATAFTSASAWEVSYPDQYSEAAALAMVRADVEDKLMCGVPVGMATSMDLPARLGDDEWLSWVVEAARNGVPYA